jgi:hypothetical protein
MDETNVNAVPDSTVPALTFLIQTKKQLKESKSRKRYDEILGEINQFLINTRPQKNTIDQTEPQMILLAIPKGNGQNDFITMPRVANKKGGDSDAPRAEIPIAFSKILTAASVISSNAPDGQTYSMNKIKARLFYDLWKRTWTDTDMNGMNTLDFATQQLIASGTGAWRIYPKRVVLDKTGANGSKSKKVLYDDLYREPMDMNRTWLGTSYKPFSDMGRPEVLWEIDVTNEEYAKLKRSFNKRKARKDLQASSNLVGGVVSQEAQNEDNEKSKTHHTITFYENPLSNRYIIASNDTCFYDGEMPNDEIYGSVVVGHCFHSNFYDQYGIGYYEMMRGNQTIQNYIESLTVEQVVGEIFPIMFGTGTMQGDMTLKRSPNYLNVLPAGMKIDKITATGNSTLGMNFMDRLKNENDEITGINDIVSGEAGDGTLGQSVLQKEAALARLVKPRNSMSRMMEKDFCIAASWMEQDQVNDREFIFANQEQADAFKQLNPMFSSTQVKDDTDVPEDSEDTGIVDEGNDIASPDKTNDSLKVKGKIRILSSPRVPVSFDFKKADLEESGYQDQDINEAGKRNILVPRAKALQDVKSLETDGKIGYDKVILIIDQTSMLIPSIEIQKQVMMQLYPIAQNAITQIFQMAQQQPDLAKAQLTSFEHFLTVQKQNIYDFMPKSSYDQIMSGSMTPPPQPQPPQSPPMQPPQGENPNQPNPNQPLPATGPAQNNPPMGQAFNGGVANMGLKIGNNAKK